MTDLPATVADLNALNAACDAALARARQARRDLWKTTLHCAARLIRSSLPDAAVIVIDADEGELHEVADATGSTLWYAPASAGRGLPDPIVAAVDVMLHDALGFGRRGTCEAAWSLSAKGRPYLYKTLPDTAAGPQHTARGHYPAPDGMTTVTACFTPGEGAFTFDGANVRHSRETRDRIRAAVLNSGLVWPAGRIMLAAHDNAPTGPGADLTLACTVLAAAGQLNPAVLEEAALLGELGLDGAVRPVRGLTGSVRTALDCGVTEIVVAEEDAARLEVPVAVTVQGVRDLRHAIDVLNRTAPAV
ncbi:magnesium chelatase domain-containing protein [Streptomyces sp. HPF1205]|uniref:magnesium chelatase domain-containing protein n=1 Tax=Streptomyces sp. HPF1205 TaxID=2873262 RepID=UPI001CECE8A0|nr:magnesium chelatase domain-containing protein [Streptomyces sp. HPF1205]